MFKEIFDIFCHLSFNSKDMKNYLSDGEINSYAKGVAMLVRKFELSPSSLWVKEFLKNSYCIKGAFKLGQKPKKTSFHGVIGATYFKQKLSGPD